MSNWWKELFVSKPKCFVRDVTYGWVEGPVAEYTFKAFPSRGDVLFLSLPAGPKGMGPVNYYRVVAVVHRGYPSKPQCELIVKFLADTVSIGKWVNKIDPQYLIHHP